MKRIYVVILLSLVSIIGMSCPRPSGHAIVLAGCGYYLNDLSAIRNGKENLAFTYSIGYETSNRYNTISLCGDYVFGMDYFSIGAEYKINPLGERYGYDTPVNFNISASIGYRNTGAVYTDLGLEIYGNMGSYVTIYAQDKVGRDYSVVGGNNLWHNEVSAGIRLWIGKSW